MKILNLLEACFIMGDALALRMILASNKRAKATPNLMPPRNYLILLRVRLPWFRIERVTFDILRTIYDKTSQVIRPTYSCPCPSDLGQPCRCT
jgi:hypothetical protein